MTQPPTTEVFGDSRLPAGGFESSLHVASDLSLDD